MDSNDLIEQILQEQQSSSPKDEMLANKYSVDDLLNEPSELEKKEDEQTTQNILSSYDSSSQSVSSSMRKESVNKNKITIPDTLESPLDIINYIEIEHFKELKLENSFPLRNHKETSNYKINSLEFEPLNISNEIFDTQGTMYTSMFIKKDLLYLGTSIGDIFIFSFKSEKKVSSMITPKELKQIPVNCMDISDDDKFLFAGYENGAIAMIEVATGKYKTIVSNVHYKSCINIKFYKREEKFFYFFSSDIDGNVYKTTIKDSFFSYKFDGAINVYTHNNNPSFLIKIIRFSEKEQKMYELSGLSAAVLFSTVDSVSLYMIEPEMKKIFEFNKPKYISESAIPDICYGLGKPPVSFNVKSDNIKSQVLLCISWGKLIYVFLMPISKNQFNEPVQIGYYINTYNILRVGFLSESLIFFFDDQKFVKVIDSRQVNIGGVILKKTDKNINQDIEIPKDNNKAELDPGRLIDPDIKYQCLFKDKNSQSKRTFINFIYEEENKLYLLAKSKIYIGRLLEWSKCLKNLLANEEWLNLLVTGIEIYQARNPSLTGIPTDEAERKLKVGKHLQDTISQYVLFITRKARVDSLPSGLGDSQDRKEISNCIDIAIEFCIEIEKVDYLLSQIEPIFDEKDYANLFLEKMEPFILADKIINVDLGKEIIQKIVELYKKEKNYSMLSQILLHINTKNINDKAFLDGLESHGIFSPSIYVYSNMEKEDYFTPLKKIFEYFKGSRPIISYDGDFKKFCQTNSDLNEIKSGKEYYGYLIFWYFRWFLTQKKFPDKNKQIEFEPFSSNLCLMTYWFLSQEVLDSLNKVDSECYFDILGRIFSSRKNVGVLNKKSEDKEFKMDCLGYFINDTTYYVKSIDTMTMLEYLVEVGNLKLSKKCLIYMYQFIAHASYCNEIPKKLAMKAAGYLLENYSTYILEYNNDNLFKISNDVINLFSNSTSFTESDYLILLGQTRNCPLDKVKLFLYKKTNSHRQCLELFLYPEVRIEKRTETMISFINTTLTKLQSKKDSAFTTFKNEVLIRIVDIGNLSPPNLNILVDSWYSKEKKLVLNQLEKDPKLELQYIQQEVEKINKNIKEENNAEETEDMSEILKLHIQLLCTLKEYDKVLPALKSNSFYPEDVLPMCIAYKVYDAAIYLYQAKGDPEKGLELALSLMDEIYSNIKSKLVDPKFDSENIFFLLLNDFTKSVSQCTEICEKNELKFDELWFKLSKTLYSYFGEVNTQDKAKQKELHQHMKFFEDFEKKLSKEIKNLLEKMCSYVSIKKIIENVTENYKNAGIKEFREILTQMLNNYSNLTKIYLSAKELLCNSVVLNENELLKSNSKGNNFAIERCDECDKDFEKIKCIPEKILIFPCGHICHDKCAAIEGNSDSVCSVCRRNEVESSIITSDEQIIRKGSYNEQDDFGEDTSVPQENRQYFNKLKNFDRFYSENYNNVKYLLIYFR
ncbi:MAG: hypothetical protein MJ252_10100 [archaeon]|nr:hypothetical protein [archaeon]